MVDSRLQRMKRAAHSILEAFMNVYRNDVQALLAHYPLNWYQTTGIQIILDALLQETEHAYPPGT